MRIWRFAAPRDSGFAEVERRGAWTPSTESGPCPECGASRQQRVKPMRLVWKPGSDVIGDFVWAGFGPEVVVTERVFEAFTGCFSGFESGPVEMLDDLELRGAERKRPRLTLPYSGPSLRELWVTCWVGIDRERSSAELERRCATCGTEFWEAYGIERWDSHFDIERQQLVRELVPRAPKGGLFVGEEALAGGDVFRLHEFPGWSLCTDAVREHVEKEGYTNVAFLEIGETF